MAVEFLRERFAERADAPAVASPAGDATFGELLEAWNRWAGELDRRGLAAGAVVTLEGEFSPNAIALFFALAERFTDAGEVA